MDASVHPLRVFRLAKNPQLRLEDLARRVRVTKATLSRIETGKQGVSDSLLHRLVAETGIPAERFRPDLAPLFQRPQRAARSRAGAKSRAA